MLIIEAYRYDNGIKETFMLFEFNNPQILKNASGVMLEHAGLRMNVHSVFLFADKNTRRSLSYTSNFPSFQLVSREWQSFG